MQYTVFDMKTGRLHFFMYRRNFLQYGLSQKTFDGDRQANTCFLQYDCISLHTVKIFCNTIYHKKCFMVIVTQSIIYLDTISVEYPCGLNFSPSYQDQYWFNKTQSFLQVFISCAGRHMSSTCTHYTSTFLVFTLFVGYSNLHEFASDETDYFLLCPRITLKI